MGNRQIALKLGVLRVLRRQLLVNGHFGLIGLQGGGGIT